MASSSKNTDAYDSHVAPEYVGKKLEEENLAAARALTATVARLSGKINSLAASDPATELEERARRERVIASHPQLKEIAKRLLQTLVDRERTRSSEIAETTKQMDALSEAAFSLCQELRVGLQQHISSLIKSNSDSNKSCKDAQRELNETKILLKGVQLELEQLRAQVGADNGSTELVNEEMSKLRSDIAKLLEQRSQSKEKESTEHDSKLTDLNTNYLIAASAREQAENSVKNLTQRLDAKISELEEVRGDLGRKLAKEERRSEGFEKDVKQLETANKEHREQQAQQLERITALAGRVRQAELTAKEKEASLAVVSGNSKVLQKKVDILQQESTVRVQEVQRLNWTLVQRDLRINGLISTVQERVTELEERRKDHEAKEQALKEELTLKINLISSRDQTIDELKSANEQLQVICNEKDATITNLQTTRPAQLDAEDIRKANDNFLLKSEVRNLEAAKLRLTQQLNDAESTRSTLCDSLDRSKTGLAEKTKELGELQVHFKSLKKQSEVNLQDNEKLRSQLDQETATSDRLKCELKDAEERIASLHLEHKGVLESKDSIYSQLEGMYSKLEESSKQSDGALRQVARTTVPKKSYDIIMESHTKCDSAVSDLRERARVERNKLEGEIVDVQLELAALQAEHSTCAARLSKENSLSRSHSVDSPPAMIPIQAKDVLSPDPIPQREARVDAVESRAPSFEMKDDQEDAAEIDPGSLQMNDNQDMELDDTQELPDPESPGGVPLYPYFSRESSVTSLASYQSPYTAGNLGRGGLHRSESPYYADNSNNVTPARHLGRRSETSTYGGSQQDVEMEDAPTSGQREPTDFAAGLPVCQMIRLD
jgi:chromosome segregation ATPase